MAVHEDFVQRSKREWRDELTVALLAEEIAAVEGTKMEPGLEHLNAELPRTKP
jgi:hypothetical protein